ncbi:hypothetical protein HanPSC8_Chr04g0139541 [Helianthus annuus]|nr:hypothetical protein HanPSC8_Chr04g0139541 [Helianthus annuus]
MSISSIQVSFVKLSFSSLTSQSSLTATSVFETSTVSKSLFDSEVSSSFSRDICLLLAGGESCSILSFPSLTAQPCLTTTYVFGTFSVILSSLDSERSVLFSCDICLLLAGGQSCSILVNSCKYIGRKSRF